MSLNVILAQSKSLQHCKGWGGHMQLNDQKLLPLH